MIISKKFSSVGRIFLFKYIHCFFNYILQNRIIIKIKQLFMHTNKIKISQFVWGTYAFRRNEIARIKIVLYL